MLKQQQELPRALNLWDLVLFNFVAVIGITWIATAARAGPGSLTLWLLAAILFFIPQGLAVIQLSSSYPAAGGIYAWTREEFGEAHGFLCGWCYWINNMLFYPTLLIAAAVNATYVFQNTAGWADRWNYVLPFTIVGLAVAVLLNLFGVAKGKWLQNLGGFCVYLPGLLLIGMGLHAFLTRAPANPFSWSALKPELTNLPVLNLWATIAFAFAGLELSSTMGQEVREPRRNLPRAIYVAAPFVALIYICGTGSLLWIVPQSEINIVAGPIQLIAMESSRWGWWWSWVAPLSALALTVARIGGVGAWLTGSARVAFAVGLDRYLPASFAKIHPRWRTPHVAILVQVPVTIAFLCISVLGKGTTVEAAFLILIDMSLLIYFIPYLYLFLCFIVHCRHDRGEPALLVPFGRLGALVAGLCGLLVTLIAMAVALIPPPGTMNIWLHEIKLAGGSLLLIAAGLLFYYRGRINAVRAPARQ